MPVFDTTERTAWHAEMDRLQTAGSRPNEDGDDRRRPIRRKVFASSEPGHNQRVVEYPLTEA